jgi:tetratricopeptide (TPR) repeat protein
MMFRFFLGEALLIHDNADQALAQFEEAEKASPQYYQRDFNPIPVTRRFYAGRAFLKKGRIDQAVSAAEEISRIISEQGLPAEFLDFRSILEAEISLARNKPEDTLRILEKTGYFSWESSPHFWRAKAAAEEAQGRWESAAECYRKFLGLVTLARENYCDPVRYFYELSMADYNLGRIAEKIGNPVSARDHYQKFLERMRAADPGIPEVADARKRLAALG